MQHIDGQGATRRRRGFETHGNRLFRVTRIALALMIAVMLVGGGQVVDTHEATAAAEGSLPFEIVTIGYNGEAYRDRRGGYYSCQYYVLALFDEDQAYQYDSGSGPRPHITVTRPNLPGPTPRPAFDYIPPQAWARGFETTAEHGFFPEYRVPAGKLAYFWYAAADDYNSFFPPSNPPEVIWCRDILEPFAASGQAPANAALHLGLFSNSTVASFTHEVKAGVRRTIAFTSTSQPEPRDGLLHEWDFGDGETGTGANVEHKYDAPGSYDVTLTVGTGDQRDTATATVEVRDGLGGAIFRPNGPGNTVRVGETVDVTLRVENETGVDLTDLEVVRAEVVPVGSPEAAATLTGPIGRDLVGELAASGPGAMDFADFRLRGDGTVDGDVQLEIEVHGRDLLGELVTETFIADFSVQASELAVLLELDPQERVMEEDDGDPEPIDVVLTIRIENTSADPIESIRIDPIDIFKTHPDQVLQIEQIAGLMPDRIDPAVVIESLGAGEISEPFTATFRTKDDGDIDFRVFARGVLPGPRAAVGFATVTLQVSPTKYLEFRTYPTDPIPGPLHDAGKDYVVDGFVKNLSNTAPLEVGPVYPSVTGNIGLMSLAWEGAAPDPRDTTGDSSFITLKPGQRRDFQVRVTTNRSDPRARDVQPSGGTRLVLDFEPWAIATETDGSQTVVRTFDTNVAGMDADGRVKAKAADLRVQVSIDDSIAIPEYPTSAYVAGIGVGVVEGLYGAGVMFVQSIPDIIRMPFTVVAGVSEYQSRVWAAFTEEEKAYVVDSMVFWIVPVLKKNYELAVQDGPELYNQVHDYVETAMTDLANEWETGDAVSVARLYTKYGSEAIGSVALPLALTRLAKTPQAVAALNRAQAALQVRMAPVMNRIALLNRIDEVLPALEALEEGTIASKEVLAKLFGISLDELAELQRLADKYNVILTVRSRHESSIKWIKKFGAMLKPQAIQIKSVSELDANLGYRLDDVGSVVFRRPDVLKDGVPADLDAAVEAFVRSKGFKADTPEHANAVQRVKDRVDEWVKYEAEYKAAAKRGWLRTDFDYEGNDIPDPNVKGSTKAARYTGFEMKPVGPPGNEEYVIKLMDNRTNKFRRVTGDIDPIAFTHKDGQPLSPKDHKALIDDMRKSSILRAQHPESATYAKPKDGDGIAFVKKQFGDQTLIQVAGGSNEARIVRFNADKSRWVNPRDHNLIFEGGFIDIGQVARPNAPKPSTWLVDLTSKAADQLLPRALFAYARQSSVGRCEVSFGGGGLDGAVFMGSDGYLQRASADGSVSRAADLHEQCFAEGPKLKIQIQPVAQLVALVGDLFSVQPFADGAQVVVEPGDRQFALAESEGGATTANFQVGDVILLGAGTERAERRVIGRLSERGVEVTEGFSVAHTSDEIVLRIKEADSMVGGGGVDDDDELPVTGSDPIATLLQALALIAIGAALRRRRLEIR